MPVSRGAPWSLERARSLLHHLEHIDGEALERAIGAAIARAALAKLEAMPDPVDRMQDALGALGDVWRFAEVLAAETRRHLPDTEGRRIR